MSFEGVVRLQYGSQSASEDSHVYFCLYPKSLLAQELLAHLISDGSKASGDCVLPLGSTRCIKAPALWLGDFKRSSIY